jgi:hypothetical protein
MPKLANFLVGNILEDSAAPEGQASARARIGARVGVTPLGLATPRVYAALSREGTTASYGRSEALICPHYVRESKTCGIWQHRDAICSTWFCKHVRGAVGLQFWKEGVGRLLASIEGALARWCVLEIGLGEEALVSLAELVSQGAAESHAGREIDGVVDEASYLEVWGAWAGREREFFVECARRVEPLSWSDVVSIGGSEVGLRAAVARTTHDKLLATEPPKRVRAGSFRVVSGDRERVHLATYSTYDSIDVPRALLDVLHRFDGAPLTEALAKVAEDGVEMDTEMVRYLVDFGVLEDVAG